MKKVFVVKEGSTFSFVLVLGFVMFLYFAVQTQLIIAWILLALVSIGMCIASVQFLIWNFTGFAFKIDFEQKKIILNHSFWFYKKQISFEDVIEIRIEKSRGYLVVSKTTNLTKRQKRMSKGDDISYKIHLKSISVDYLELLQEVFCKYSSYK
jgi:hypothetical protein